MNTLTTNRQTNLVLVTGILLCIAAFTFPFSVAATNSALALALIAGVASGQLRQGIIHLWQQQHRLSLAILIYLALVLLGLIWSLDRHYGLEVAGHLWLWLSLPILIAALQNKKWRNHFLIALSSGLVLHLLYCVLQRLDIVPVPESAGSSLIDATGYIGHISFGIVYGVWGGWLLHFGWMHHGRNRLISWLLSFWAFAMIYLAEGRSGYLVAAAVLSIVFWKHLISGRSPKRMFGAIAVFAVLAAIVAFGPGKERIVNTLEGIHAAWNGDLEKVEERWLIWMNSANLWREYPLIGVGTGGYSTASKKLLENHPELVPNSYRRKQETINSIKAFIEKNEDKPDPKNRITNAKSILKKWQNYRPWSHSHNIYLQSLVRWGPLGLLAICGLFWFWLRAGKSRPWEIHTNSLVTLSGFALIIHGLSSVSLEEHFATIFALFALAVGLSHNYEEERKA